MLSVLLKIFAILGIILLILLGFILFMILVVLFLPITYRVQGKIEDSSQKEANVKVSWLLGLLRFKLQYSTELNWQLKLLWFDLKPLLKAKKTTQKSSESVNITTEPTIKEPQVDEPIQTSTSQEESQTISPIDKSAQETTDIPPADDEPTVPKKSLGEKIDDIKEQINGILEKVSYYIDLLQQDDTKHLISHILKVLGKILKSIRPRKLKINAVFGFESPDTTGKIYGFTCMLYPYYGKDIHIIPDFERSVIQGDIYIRGRIFIIVLVINALKIILDRKLYKVIHKLKYGGNNKNGR